MKGIILCYHVVRGGADGGISLMSCTCLAAVTTLSYSSQEEPENLDIDKPDEEDFLHVSAGRPLVIPLQMGLVETN